MCAQWVFVHLFVDGSTKYSSTLFLKKSDAFDMGANNFRHMSNIKKKLCIADEPHQTNIVSANLSKAPRDSVSDGNTGVEGTVK